MNRDLVSLSKSVETILTNAGNHIALHWNDTHSLQYKDKRDVVSTVDFDVENTIRHELQKLLPETGFIVEEGISKKKSEYNWVIDPIDGTKNYVHKLPMFLTQAALLYKDELVLGVVYNPVSKQLFSAVKGNGAFLNGEKITATARNTFDEAILDLNFGGKDDDIQWKIKLFSKLVQTFYRVRMTGNFLFPYLALNAVDASITLNKKVKMVDIAPGIVILREAGLIVENLILKNGQNTLVAANKNLFGKLKDILLTSI